MEVVTSKKVLRHTKPVRIRSNPRQRSLHGFLHDLADLTRHRESSLALHCIRLDEENVTTSRSPRQSHRNSRPLCPLGNLAFAPDFDPTQELLDDVLVHDEFFGLAFGEPSCLLQADRS